VIALMAVLTVASTWSGLGLTVAGWAR
jgi:hypothetical protein